MRPESAILLLFLLLAAALTGIRPTGGRLRRPGVPRPEFVYHNESWLTDYLVRLSRHYSHITHLYSIGQSTKNRQLWVLAIGSSPSKHVLLRPEVKFIGNIHGNEVVSRELLIQLIYYLVSRYRRNDTVTALLNSTRIHVLVSMNPDGYATAERRGRKDCVGVVGRNNWNNQDLNRNFPDFFIPNNNVREPETVSVMRWMDRQQFVLSASLHGGAMVVNYPYDNLPKGHKSYYHGTPDDDVFVHLAKSYSFAHPLMHRGFRCPWDSSRFRYGIVNGASWYIVKGSMQDYNYVYAGCMELTIEVSCCKFPDESDLEMEWKRNKDSLIKLYSQVNSGVKGLLLDPAGKPLHGVPVYFSGRDRHPTRTTQRGEFWKILLPGRYEIKIAVPDYEEIIHSFNLPPTRDDFQSNLVRPGQRKRRFIINTYYDDQLEVTTLKIQLRPKVPYERSVSPSPVHPLSSLLCLSLFLSLLLCSSLSCLLCVPRGK